MHELKNILLENGFDPENKSDCSLKRAGPIIPRTVPDPRVVYPECREGAGTNPGLVGPLSTSAFCVPCRQTRGGGGRVSGFVSGTYDCLSSLISQAGSVQASVWLSS